MIWKRNETAMGPHKSFQIFISNFFSLLNLVLEIIIIESEAEEEHVVASSSCLRKENFVKLFVKSLFQFSPSWHLIWKLGEWANCKSCDGIHFFAFIANGSMDILYMYRCTQFTEIIRGIKSNQDRVWESLRSVDVSHPGLS